MKLCSKVVEAGQAYSSANQLFLGSLSELSLHQEEQGVITVRTLTFLMMLTWLTQANTVLCGAGIAPPAVQSLGLSTAVTPLAETINTN